MQHLVIIGFNRERGTPMDKSQNVHIDTITTDKMNFKVINRYLESEPKSSKDIEKRLFEVFKKYEQAKK